MLGESKLLKHTAERKAYIHSQQREITPYCDATEVSLKWEIETKALYLKENTNRLVTEMVNQLVENEKLSCFAD